MRRFLFLLTAAACLLGMAPVIRAGDAEALSLRRPAAADAGVRNLVTESRPALAPMKGAKDTATQTSPIAISSPAARSSLRVLVVMTYWSTPNSETTADA